MDENKQEVVNASNEQKSNDINKDFKARIRRGRIKKIIKRIIFIAIIVGIFYYLKNNAPQVVEEKEFDFDEKVASYQDLDVTVEGDGVITANSIYNIVPKVTGEILKDYVEPNAMVKKGQLLYVIDSKDVNNSINQASLGVEQSNLSISQAEKSYSTIQDQINDLKIYATEDGYIENLRMSEGSYVSAMSAVCDINELNVYEVTLQFHTSTAQNFHIGSKAKLFYLDYIEYVDGVVSKISDSTNLISLGAQVTDVTIRVETNGYSLQNAKVEGSVFLDDGTQIGCVNTGYLSAKSSSVVVSESTGTVKELFVENGSYVHKGDLLATLENSSLNTQLDNAQISIDNAKLSKKNAENSLSTTRKQLDNYNITSPIDGKIVYKNLKKGDVISSYQQSASNVMAVVADVSVMKFEMLIDELDITKVKVGQEVIVTIEALDNKEFIGQVTNINIIGVNAAGTTSYTVVIEIPGTDEIYSGMSVDAKIVIAEKENVLCIPLNAVRKGNVVYKKSDNPEYIDEDENVPQGYEKVELTLGLNDKEYIEVLSGLESGDIVLTDKVKASGTFNMENLANMMMEN